MAKRYYWLKLKEDFFEQRVIKKLRKIAGGDTYTIIYLKLQLLAMKNDGKLVFENVEDDFASEMALELDEDIENVKVTLMYLEKNNLIETISDEEYFLPEVLSVTGSETASAIRVREHREKKKALQCNNNVITKKQDVIEVKQECSVEKEKEKEITTNINNNNNNNIISDQEEKVVINSNGALQQEIKMLLGVRKIKPYDIIKLNKPIERIKFVIEFCDKHNKADGYLYKALKDDWELKEVQQEEKPCYFTKPKEAYKELV
nr:MAG TPA: replisome organizer protein [Caudoviricetes sp.]